ncbi:ABC transporter ATP-binding protein [Lachnospiraceae bacterium]|nr:ABC transporter ATP-binding protein [Lachnospiraceae bacterium]
MKKIVVQFWNLLYPYKKNILIIVLCLIMSAGFSLLLPIINSIMVDDGFIAGNKSLLIKLVLLMLLLNLLTVILDLLRERVRISMQSRLKFSLSKKAVDHLYQVKMKCFNKKNHSQIFTMIHTDIDSICQIADQSLFFAFTQIFTICGGVIGLFILNYKLAFLVMLLIPIKYIITSFFAKKNQLIMNRLIESNERYAKWFGDTFSGIRDVKLFDLKSKKALEFDSKKQDEITQNKKLSCVYIYSSAVDMGLVQFMISGVYIFGAVQIFASETTLGNIMAFITYSVYVTSPITAIVNIKQHLYKIFPSINRFNDFMSLEEDKKGYISTLSNYDITFDSVTFAYDENKPILNNASFKVPQNTKLAIIGLNGSGKTTILNLLLRLYDVNFGTISISGFNITDIDLSLYRSMFSVVSQEVYLFNDTIRNNICLYRNYPKDKVNEVIEMCGLSKMIKEKSLDYVIGDKGALLSGGQRQKLSLARALLKDAPIFILDEATSNTDTISENFIITKVLSSLKNKTIITVLHNISYLSENDLILLLENGTVVAYGKYDELLSSNADFRDFIGCKTR